MSDIIQDAKQLQSELQSERADWVKMRGGIDIEMPLDCTVLYGDEEARDVIGALAEEEYQYGVTYTGLKHGGQHVQWVESTGDTEWDKETLQWLIKRWKKQGQSPKTVRRRVSPPEVISD